MHTTGASRQQQYAAVRNGNSSIREKRKIPEGQSNSLIEKKTDNVMAKNKKDKHTNISTEDKTQKTKD